MAEKINPSEQTTILQSKLNSLLELASSGQEPPVGCEKCENGQIKIPKDFGWDIKMCECYDRQQELKNQLAALAESNISRPELQLYPVSGFQQERLKLDGIVKFALGKSEKKWLYLFGGPGTGKTYTGILAALFAIVSGRTALYVNTPDLLEAMRPGHDEDGKQWMNMCKRADLLILDDIGQEKGSEWVSERLYLVINNRYREGKNTVFTSNFSLEDLKVSPAIISRLRHFSQIVDFKRNDKRITNL